jgi:hypothetical protein
MDRSPVTAALGILDCSRAIIIGKPVSAKQNLFPPRSCVCTLFCRLLSFFLFLVPSHLRAGSLEDAAHELAMKVCAAPPKQPVNVHWPESAEFSGYPSASPRKAFLEQISACGISPTESSDAPVLRVTVLVTASQVLLIADSADALNGRQIRMVELPRSSLSASTETAPGPHLNSELLWQQQKPIESAIEWRDPSSQERFLFLLSDGLLLRIRFDGGTSRVMDSTELPEALPRSRSADATFIYTNPGKPLALLLDGNLCDFNPSGRISFACNPGNLAGKALQISSNCEEAPRYLAAGKGDYSQPDRIALRGLLVDEAAPPPQGNGSDSVELPGPVIGISIASDAKAAFAAVRNLSTGNYEVYRITAVCSD